MAVLKRVLKAEQRLSEAVKHPVLRLHAEARDSSLQDRFADGVTYFAGSMVFVYLHVVWFIAWVLLKPFGDNFPFGLLTMLVSLEAIFLSTFIMISQNRADSRRQLLADEGWRLVKAEEAENQQIITLTKQIWELTTQVHVLTSEMHALVTNGPLGASLVDAERRYTPSA